MSRITELSTLNCLHIAFAEYFYQRLQFLGVLQHHQCVGGAAGAEGERWKKTMMNLESFTLYSPLTFALLHYCYYYAGNSFWSLQLENTVHVCCACNDVIYDSVGDNIHGLWLVAVLGRL